jgi:flavin reductase (DIM6/NTAB) family NADH-FMN oxidoreductase RutF
MPEAGLFVACAQTVRSCLQGVLMPDSLPDNVHLAFDQIPCGHFLLTAAWEGRRSGILARWVQQCSDDPRHVMVAVAKAMPVEPLIRDSHCFALCQLAHEDRFLHRKFATPPTRSEDPFDSIDILTAPTGSPIVKRAMCYLDCEVTRLVELNENHWLYVGLVRSGGMLNTGKPAIHLGSNGCVEYADDFHAA